MPEGTPRPFERQIHPGSGRRKAPLTPKGRQLDIEALAEVQALLGERPRRADLLIEHLHLIQDAHGHLSARHLRALAEEMNLPMAAVYEVASFYAHFDIVLDGEAPPPPLTIRVCESITCEMMGAQDLLKALPQEVGEKVRVVPAPCMGRCHCAPVAEVGHRHVDHATLETLAAAVQGDHHPVIPDYTDYDGYTAEGGYALLRACLAGERTPEDLVEALSHAGLRGLGGAGFPTGKKWEIVRGYPGPRLMTINGD
ncbi:MAG TPA: NADH-quinone oxidoreductase subunit F, partial [Kiloniellaceae bacterium]|nr:NADH-quinone oxidoreductase subunit F [Kiloniellaceae bacterium]